MKHYLNEVGTDFVVDTGVVIATTDTIRLYYKKPNGVTGTWLGATYDSYSELAKATGTYFILYTLAQTTGTYDINVSGEWKFQAFIGSASGTWWGETFNQNIYNQFE